MALGIHNPIIEAGDTLKALLFIMVVVCIVYVVYLVWAYGYVRPATLGHSEQFEAYMVEYLAQVLDLLRRVRGISGDARFAGVQDALSKLEAVHRKVTGGQDLLAVTDTTPATCPQVYALLIFYDAISRGDKHELSMLNKFVDHAHVHQYYEGDSKTSIGDITPLQELRAAFGLLRANVQAAAHQLMDAPDRDANANASIIALCTLDKLLNQYIDTGRDNILKSYNLRKTGGRSAIIFRIYLSEYATYCFKETIPQTWKGFGKQVNQTASAFQATFSSPRVQKMVEQLPFKIAGVEGFETNDDGQEEQRQKWREWEKSKEGGDTETVEGFINVLKAIAKTFIGMFKLVIAAVKVVTDPAAFIRFLLGLVIGMIIYVLYLVVQAISFLFIIPAFFAVVAYKLLVTVIWTAVFCAIAAIYVVLWVLDFCTGGMVLRLLRCENLPNAWHTKPGFARGNVYKRNLLCGCRCTSRYYPTGFMCKRMPDYEPVYCPQALIFNAYSNQLEPLKAHPYAHHYKPSATYFVAKNDAQRRDLWGRIFDDRQEFSGVCREAMRPYDHITRRMCTQLVNDAGFKERNPTEHAQVMELCRLTYCKDDGTSKQSYCNGSADDEAAAKPKDIVASTAVQWIGLLLLIAASTLVYNLVRPRRVLSAKGELLSTAVTAAAAAAPVTGMAKAATTATAMDITSLAALAKLV